MSKTKTTGWQRTMRWLDAPALKRWYKKFVSRRNRRQAKEKTRQGDDDFRDKPLDPWAID
ncbi:MAG: hypothetical protein WC315_00405 [Candidatus Omnitrophota bacterium]